MINITLTVNGADRKYQAHGVTLRTSLDAYALYREYEQAAGNYDEALLERCCDFIVRCFGYAFDRQQLEAGYMGSAFRLIPNMLQAVVAYSSEAIVNFPEPATMTPETAAATD